MPEKSNMFWRNNWLAFVWAIIILILCGLPGDQIPEITFLQWLKPDKFAHLILFGVLCFLLLKGFSKQNQFPALNKKAISIALISSISYGVIVELLQETVFINRNGDIRDVFANTIGAYIGYLIFKRNFSKDKRQIL